ncbi:MAG: TonB-dependent receptor [Sphingobium sp.]|nr:TonB-dependent receptor [Sphingobium sp.]
MNKFRILLAATVAVSPFIATAAYAQSSGTIDFDEPIIITGARVQGIEGVQLPDTSKAKGVLTQEILSRGTVGNTVLDSINIIPGVSFQNNDPFGNAGGTLTVRGFGSDRVSLTFDGVPLNDTGNYAVYSSQQLDSELIEQVNVNLGSTDVDSPTAAASGGTVNYRTRLPYDKFGLTAVVAGGDYKFYRMFGSVDTGEFGPWGTKAFFAASKTGNRNVYNDLGKIDKLQVNGRVYQELGSNGDFISVAAHYSQSRNNFFGSLPLRFDKTNFDGSIRTVGPDTTQRFPTNSSERSYSVAGCTTLDVTVTPGFADPRTTCGTLYDFRYNPSNTGNLRISSRFHLTDKLVLTVDPSYQYVKANGGGTTSVTSPAREGYYDLDPASTPGVPVADQCTKVLTGVGLNCQAGYFGGAPYFGRDLNGDGDILDQFTVLAPSQTQTDRYGVISSLRYDINDNHTVRIAYTLDYGHHRQTGQVGFLMPNGLAQDVFPVNNPQSSRSLNGATAILQKRDRLSLAILNQVAGEYRGKFGGLTVTLGLRAPFFTRDLTNNCFTSSAGGFVECFGTDGQIPANVATLRPTWAPPQNRVLKYNKLLPNVGLVYKFTPAASVYFNYAKGLQVPSTDSLYNSFFFPFGSAGSKPAPETTDSFELGGRYTTRTLQFQGTVWYTKYLNRLASAYDPDLDQTIYRNLGQVDKWGIDGSLSWQPIKQLTFYTFGSYMKSKIKDDIPQFETSGGAIIYTPTAGKRESGAPVFQVGGRAQVNLDHVSFGFEGKRTGKRYVYDNNLPTFRRNTDGSDTMIYGAVAPGYTLFNLDVRASLAILDSNLNKSYVQFNVSNVFDKFYVGGFGGGLTQTINRNKTTGAVTGYGNPGFVQIGSPRAMTLSLHLQM